RARVHVGPMIVSAPRRRRLRYWRLPPDRVSKVERCIHDDDAGTSAQAKQGPQDRAAVVVQESLVPTADHEVGNDDDDVALWVIVAHLQHEIDERGEELAVTRLEHDELRLLEAGSPSG